MMFSEVFMNMKKSMSSFLSFWLG